MIPSDVFFNFLDRKYAMILPLLVPCIGWWLFRFRQNTVERFAAKEVLENILIPRSKFNYWAKIAALTLALLLAVIAWMEPLGNAHYPPGLGVPRKTEETIFRRLVHDVIFLVDASASMAVKDTRTGENRFAYAKEIVDEVVSRLRGQNVSLWSFTSEPTMMSPLTMDYLFARLRIKQMEINEGNIAGTDFMRALEILRKEYFSTLSPRHKTLIILSDGGDNGPNKVDLVQQADALNLHVYTVGMGSKEGGAVPDVSDEGKPVISRLEPEILRTLAKQGRGDYYTANETNAVELAKILISKIEKESGFEAIHAPATLGKDDLIYDLYFQIPIGAAILLLLFVLFFPDTRKKRVL